MASYLRPRRGKKATALSQNITLKAGEVFFETPTTGVGTGAGRIMMGNGSNNYTYLNNNKKAFITDINCPDCYISNFTATAGNTTLTNNDTYLNNMKPGATASTFFTNLWTLLSSHNKQLTQLNNDKAEHNYGAIGAVSLPQGSSKTIGTISIPNSSNDNRNKSGFICIRFNGAIETIAELHLSAKTTEINSQSISVSHTKGFLSPSWSITLPIASGQTVKLSSWSVVEYSIDVYWEYFLFY